jgi:hypothetical protein
VKKNLLGVCLPFSCFSIFSIIDQLSIIFEYGYELGERVSIINLKLLLPYFVAKATSQLKV